MIRTIYPIDALQHVTMIHVGRQTETGVECIRFDCSTWLSRWPGMELSVWPTAPGSDTAYEAQTHMDGNVIVWDVSGSDTITPGKGYVEVLGMVDGRRKLSARVQTMVIPSGLAATADPPESQQPWFERAMGASGNANWSAEDAGSLLYIGEGGLAHPLKLGAGLAIVDGVLTITDTQVVRAVCGTVLAGQVKCGEV